jgi:SAM-dependent methyltransferase
LFEEDGVMSLEKAFYELFGPLAQGAPGDEASTLQALDRVPDHVAIREVLDLGVGHGRTTLTLARALPEAHVTGVEIHAPFVEKAAESAHEAGVADRIELVCASMEHLEVDEGSVDLVWSEGSIYLLGVERALSRWRPWLRPGGCVAFSDFVWWTDTPSRESRDFWAEEYPQMASAPVIRARAEAAGYAFVDSFRLSKEAHAAYYVPLEARVAELAARTDASDDLARVLEDTRREIDILCRFADEGGYTFFVVRKCEG